MIARGRELQFQALRRLSIEQYASRDIPDAERKGELLARTIIATGEMAARMVLDTTNNKPKPAFPRSAP